MHTVVMRPPTVVEGRVTDAATGEPIGKFDVVPILDWETGSVFQNREDRREGVDGAFSYELTRLDCSHMVRIEAAGYASQRVEGILSLRDGDLQRVRLEPEAVAVIELRDARGRVLYQRQGSLETPVFSTFGATGSQVVAA